MCYNKPKWLDIEEYKKLKQETDTKVENYRVQYNKCGDFSSLVLPVSGKTNALNFGVRGRAPLCRFMIMHDFQLANNDVPVFVPLSPFFCNIL